MAGSWQLSSLENWEVGNRGHFVARPSYMEEDWILGTDMASGALVAFTKVPIDLSKKVTLFDIRKSDQLCHGHSCFEIDAVSKWFQMDEADSRISQVIDLCSGLGGFSVGFSFYGLPTVAAVDHSALAVEAFEVAHGIRPISKSVMNDEVICQLLEAQQGKRSLITLGFPCQPHSKQGDRKGFEDQRAQVLPRCLGIAYLLQCRLLLLENVAEAGRNLMLQQMIECFASVMEMGVAQVVLNLDDAWPARRSRWFAILSPVSYGQLEIRALPRLGYTKVADIFDEISAWPLPQEIQLKWNTFEKEIYSDPQFLQEPRDLNLQGVMPTALHSWGSALFACPCGCRQYGFSFPRLRQSGLRGLKIMSPWHSGFPRHPHRYSHGFSSLHADGGTSKKCFVLAWQCGVSNSSGLDSW